MMGMWRKGNSNGSAWVLKSVRVFTLGPPSRTRVSTPNSARREESVPPPAPEPITTTSYSLSGMRLFTWSCSQRRRVRSSLPRQSRDHHRDRYQRLESEDHH